MHKLFRVLVAGTFAFFFTSLAGVAFAGERTFGPFTIDDTRPDVIAMNGEIDAGSALNFRRALQAAPEAKLITLNSLGGNVQMGLLIADDIYQRRLATYIPKTSKCYSACSYIFLAGSERKAEGELGVHQISSSSPDLVGAQLAISDIIEVLNRFDTSMDVMHIMFKTPPDDMYVFNEEEIDRFKLNRTGNERLEKPAVDNTPASTVDIISGVGPLAADKLQSDASTNAIVAPSIAHPQSQATLSPLEEFTKSPNRIAVYTGLDLFGGDVSAIRVGDTTECAQSCLGMNGQCKAFTFNISPNIKKGPNCFLKASVGRADGNSVAFSGRFLSGADSDPEPFSLGMIDPAKALYDDIDLPGGDLSPRPHPSAKSPLSCRLACIDENRCVAFTYVKPKKECWLKGAVGSPVFGKGMVTGIKRYQTFAPARVITLN